MTQLPPDFKEFLKLLNSKQVEYLLVGGYAVSFHGYPRTTGDMDIWIAVSPSNASRVIAALSEFGFEDSTLSPALLQTPEKIFRMGVSPMRIELLTSITTTRAALGKPCVVIRVVYGTPWSRTTKTWHPA